MGDPQQHRDLPKIPEEQPTRVLTPEQKRELTIDTMASWALDGLHPTARPSRASTSSWPADSRRANTSRS
jgi:hypothetical protein